VVLILKSKPERLAFVIPYGTKSIGKAMGGRKAASLPARRKQRRLGQHEAALQRKRLLTEIQILSEQETSQVVFAHKARVLLDTAWFQATWSGKQDILRAVDWMLRLERKRYTMGFDK
jgi:hypothetical protein